MKTNRRLFLIFSSIALIGFQQHKFSVNAGESNNWFNEVTSTVKGAVNFVDDVRAVLKKQGIEIDREKIKPFISELNTSVNVLLASLVNLRDYTNSKNSKDNLIASRVADLGTKMNRLIRSMENLFKRMSQYDTALEKHRGTIYQLVGMRSATVERIRTIAIRPSGSKVDRMTLRSELYTAIGISKTLLQSIQDLIKELL
jgi:uncharacterized protein YoxC